MAGSAERRLKLLSGNLVVQPYKPNLVINQDVLRGGGEEVDPVVIGGMVLDIHAIPSMPANPRTTTPGKVHYVLGGVARNIAECMSKFGTNPYMISVIGLDVAGNLLLEHMKSAGLSIQGIQRRKDIDTAVICNIFDMNGELASAVASVQAIEKFLNPEWIMKSDKNISAAPLVMVDANLSVDALEASCQMAAESDIPVWFEPVSVAKSKRIASVAKYITIASPNEDELVAMSNTLSFGGRCEPIQRDNSTRENSTDLFLMLKPAISVLLASGIKFVLVTVGSDGLFLCSKGNPGSINMKPRQSRPSDFQKALYENMALKCSPTRFSDARECKGNRIFTVHFPSIPASVGRLTGAGDCLVGGVISALCSGLDIFQSAAVGVAAAKAAVESETNVPTAFNLDSIIEDATLVYHSARVIVHQSML